MKNHRQPTNTNKKPTSSSALHNKKPRLDNDPHPNSNSNSNSNSNYNYNYKYNPPSEFPHPLPPPILYGLDNLDRRTITLSDGTVKTYFALPPDHPTNPLPQPQLLGFPSRHEEDEDKISWLRENIRKYGNNNNDNHPSDATTTSSTRLLFQEEREQEKNGAVPEMEPEEEEEVLRRGGGGEGAVTKAFLKFCKLINEKPADRNKYLEDDRNNGSTPLQCIVCGRDSKDFTGVHALIMHAYTSQTADLRIKHLGLHKALCVLMGWNYVIAPESSKAYHSLSADVAAANREDLIIWPPTVIIHNTNSGRRKDGRMDGMGNQEMSTKLQGLGFGGGTSKSLYWKGEHLGITAVRFPSSKAGLKEADRLAEYFEKKNLGRKGWALVEASKTGDDENNPVFVKVDEKTGEKERILYGYLATAFDFEKVDIDTRKKAVVKSRKEFYSSH